MARIIRNSLLIPACIAVMCGICSPAFGILIPDIPSPSDSSSNIFPGLTLGTGSENEGSATLKQALEKINTGHPADAIPIINHFLVNHPNVAPAHEILGTALALTGKLEEGLAELRQAVAIEPKQYTAYTKIGDILLAQGKDVMAKRALLKAEKIAPDDRYTQQRLGQLSEKAGKFDQAIAYYKKGIIGTNAGYLGVKVDLARLYNQRGAFESAKELLEPALAVSKSRDAIAHTVLGLSYLGLNKPKQAIQQFEAARLAAPSYEGGYLGLGIAYRETGKFNESVSAFGKIIKLKPKWSTGYFQLGETYVAMGRFKEAAAQFEQSAKLSPRPLLSEKRMADALAAAGDLNKAISIYEKISQSPDAGPIVFLALGKAYQLNGQFPQAKKILETVLKRYPRLPEGYLALGEYFGYIKNYKNAIATFKDGLKITPKYPRLLKALSIAYSRVADYDHAIQSARALVELDHKNISSQILLASIYDESGNAKEAEIHYRSILNKDSKNLLVLNNLAMVLASREKNQEALRLAHRAFELAPDSPVIMDTYGWTLIKTGKLREGIEILQSALSRSKKNPAMLYHLGFAYQLKGDKQAAKKYAEQALSISSDFKEAPQARKLLGQL